MKKENYQVFFILKFLAINKNPYILYYKNYINKNIILLDIYINNIIIALNYDKAKHKIKK